MKILSLQAENVKRLTAVEIHPDGNLVLVTGRNGQGKTSVLDSIWWALEGAANIQAEPIRKGADEARIRLDLGEYVVTRTFTRKDGGGFTTGISVESADGARFPSPQKMLDKLLGSLSFDPLAFARAKPKEQFDQLRQFVPGIDFAGIENANRGDYQKRTDINRRAKEQRTLGESMVVPEAADARPVDTSALLEQLRAGNEHNLGLERTKAAHQAAREKIDGLHAAAADGIARAAALRAEAAKLEDVARQNTEAAEQLLATLKAHEALPAPVDVDAITAQVRAAQDTNAAIVQARGVRDQKAKHLEAATALEAESDALTAAMEKRTAEKDAAIAAAKMPVPGIGFGDGFVTLNGVPFEQGSDAEQLRASVAIAMAANPKLRVIRVRDGSLLDVEGMKLLAQMADEHDCQVWVEKVDSTGKIGIVIENGAVVAVEEPVRAAG